MENLIKIEKQQYSTIQLHSMSMEVSNESRGIDRIDKEFILMTNYPNDADNDLSIGQVN